MERPVAPRAMRIRAVLAPAIFAISCIVSAATAAAGGFANAGMQFVDAHGPVELQADFTILQESGPADNRLDLVFFGERYYPGDMDCAGDTAPCFSKEVTAAIEQMARLRVYQRYLPAFNIYRDDRALAVGEEDDLAGQGLADLRETEPLRFTDRAAGVAPYDYAQGILNGSRSLPGWPWDVPLPHRGVLTYAPSESTTPPDVLPGWTTFLRVPARSFYGFGGECGPAANNNSNQPEDVEWWYWLGYDQFAADDLAREWALNGEQSNPYDPVLTLAEQATLMVRGYLERERIGVYAECGPARAWKWSVMSEGDEELPPAFDAVEREAIILDFYARIRPLDGWRPNGTLRVDPSWLWVKTLSDELIDVDWYVDDGDEPVASGPFLDVAALGLSAGRHTIEAHAYDAVVAHAYSDRSGQSAYSPVDQKPHPLDLVRAHRDKLQQRVAWTVQITNAGPAAQDMRLELLPATFRADRSTRNGHEVGTVLASGLPGETTTFGLDEDAGGAFAIHRRSGRIVVADRDSLRAGTHELVVTTAAGEQEVKAPVAVVVRQAGDVLLDDDFDDGNWTTNVGGVGGGWFRDAWPSQQTEVRASVVEEVSDGEGMLSMRVHPPGHELDSFAWDARAYARKRFRFDTERGVTIRVESLDSPLSSPGTDLVLDQRAIFVGRGGASPDVRSRDPLIVGLYLTAGPGLDPGVFILGKSEAGSLRHERVDTWTRKDLPGAPDLRQAADIEWWLNRTGYVLTINGETISEASWPEGFTREWDDGWAEIDEDVEKAQLMLQTRSYRPLTAYALADEQSWNIDRLRITRGRGLSPANGHEKAADERSVNPVRYSAECADLHGRSYKFGNGSCRVSVLENRPFAVDLTSMVPDSRGPVTGSDLLRRPLELPDGVLVDEHGVLRGTPSQTGQWWVLQWIRTSPRETYVVLFRLVVEAEDALSPVRVSDSCRYHQNPHNMSDYLFGGEGCTITVVRGRNVELDLMELGPEGMGSLHDIVGVSYMPAGFTLGEDGVIRGTPERAGSGRVVVSLSTGNSADPADAGNAEARGSFGLIFDLVVED